MYPKLHGKGDLHIPIVETTLHGHEYSIHLATGIISEKKEISEEFTMPMYSRAYLIVYN